ncbi:MAG: hypothetical protein V4592_17420 [Bacteroidota bacterium]
MTILKSIWAVFAGMLAVTILSIGTDFVLEKTGITPGQEKEVYIPWMLAMALGYRSLYSVIGGYITANFAPNRPLKHAVILGCIGTALCLVGLIVQRHLPNQWYGIALAVTTLPFTWLGGKIKAQ